MTDDPDGIRRAADIALTNALTNQVLRQPDTIDWQRIREQAAAARQEPTP